MRPALLGLVPFAIVACSSDSTGNDPLLPAPGTVAIVAGASTKGVHAYTPDTLTISRATPGNIVWHNRDNVVHRLTGVFFESIPIDVPAGDSLVMAIQPAWGVGGYEYHCAIHPTMVGRVVITP